MRERPGEITQILTMPGHETAAADRLWELVYPQLRRMAQAHFKNERSHHTLSATAVVNEVYIRLTKSAPLDWEDRSHFYAVASDVMRKVLIDHARKHNAEKRNAGVSHLPLDEEIFPTDSSDASAYDSAEQALDRLAKENERAALVVGLKVFGGLTIPEIGRELKISPSTVKTDWDTARARLAVLL